jgi:hypothetical protein
VDRESKLFIIGPIMMISQRDHDVILPNHFHLHRIKRESISILIELDKIKNVDDSPQDNDLATVRVNDLWELKVLILVETHIIIG